MNGLNYIKIKQIYWAKRHGLKLSGSKGEKGLPIYTEKLEDNLFESLTKSTQTQFESGDGGEIYDSANSVAKMKALHSSSAIAVNIFQYWDKKNKVYQVAHACGLCNKGNQAAERIKFEEKFSISKLFQFGPNIDVVIENNAKGQHKIFAIECKFSEAYGSYKHNGIDPKYLKLPIWDDIPNIFEFAKGISPNDNDYKYLHPAQLIKHILGLKNKYGKRAFKLLYLWYDVHGEESCFHRKEIERFSEIVKKDDIKFINISYQKLLSNLAKHYYDGNEKYFNYMLDRYL